MKCEEQGASSVIIQLGKKEKWDISVSDFRLKSLYEEEDWLALFNANSKAAEVVSIPVLLVPMQLGEKLMQRRAEWDFLEIVFNNKQMLSSALTLCFVDLNPSPERVVSLLGDKSDTWQLDTKGTCTFLSDVSSPSNFPLVMMLLLV